MLYPLLEGSKAGLNLGLEGNKAGLNFGQEIQRDQRCIPSNYSSYIYTSPRVVKCCVFVM